MKTSVRNDCTRRGLILVHGIASTGDGPSREDEQERACTSLKGKLEQSEGNDDRAYQINSATLQLGHGKRKDGGVDKAPAGHREVNLALDAVVVDSNIVEDFRQEVARYHCEWEKLLMCPAHSRSQTVTGPLSRKTEERANQDTPAHSRSANDLAPAGLRILLLEGQGCLDLSVLSLHHCRVFIAFGVVLR